MTFSRGEKLFIYIQEDGAVLFRLNSISVIISWEWYNVWDEEEKAQVYTFTNSGIFNHPHHIGMIWEQMSFDDAVKQCIHLCIHVHA